MEVTPLFGPSAPEEGWVPAPRYVLRRQRILRQLQELAPCKVMEIGCGAGMLLQELAARGFQCSALESSAQARALIQRLAGKTGHAIDLHETAYEAWRGQFPLVMAFEVLEHIEDDVAAMREWASWLSPGGTMLISVPAHPRLWNAADVWAGHYRRYTRQALMRVVSDAGLEIEYLECIGFPLGNLTERVQARGIKRRLSAEQRDLGYQANSDRSGIDRDHVMKWFPLMRSLPGRMAMHGALIAQAMTSALPLGNGYLLRARAK
jgi:SAM-dependent methyltransferase